MNTTSVQVQITYYSRYIATLRKELDAYPNEEMLWQLVPGTTNSAGNLFLHLAGNLQHFIGYSLANTTYKRDRAAEFSLSNIPRQTIHSQLNDAEKAVQLAFGQMTDSQLSNPFPNWIIKHENASIAHALGQFLSHLAYHTGQINYHRRYFTAKAEE
ncbi:MAG: hypothetical protein ACI959_002283 [Limisphaerales bacterium]|jgi:hypothetical protein